MGQILEANPDTGLLTIQSAQRKSFLKVAPDLARGYHKRLAEMEVISIDDSFHYDRDLGYFVGRKNLSVD